MRRCCLCKKKYIKGNGSFFSIPKDERKNKWVAACQRELGSTAIICMDHFHSSSFIKIGEKIELVYNAVPAINLTSSTKEEETEEVKAKQTKRSHAKTPIEYLDDPLSTSVPKDEDILKILKKLNSRLDKIEANVNMCLKNQTNIMRNQSILSNGQNTIVLNQEEIANKLDKLGTNITSNPESMSQMLMECKVAIKKVETSVCGLDDETDDEIFDEIANMLPLTTIETVQELEQKLDCKEFSQTMITYLHKLRGTSEDVSSVIRSLFTDDLLDKYNWEGRWGKQALAKLMLFEKILREVFEQQGSLEFDKSIRKAVERSHHRIKQKKYIKNQKNMDQTMD